MSVQPPSQPAQSSLDGQKKEFKVRSAFSPAITTANYKRNFYLKSNINKEYMDNYKNYQVAEDGRQRPSSKAKNVYSNGIVYNQRTGIGVDQVSGGLPPIVAGAQEKQDLAQSSDAMFISSKLQKLTESFANKPKFIKRNNKPKTVSLDLAETILRQPMEVPQLMEVRTGAGTTTGELRGVA